jgi:hypothetical protein
LPVLEGNQMLLILALAWTRTVLLLVATDRMLLR